MNSLMEMIRTDAFLLVVFGIMLFLLIGFMMMLIRFSKLNRRYHDFMRKLGDGENLEEDLQAYMSRVEEVERHNKKTSTHVKQIDQELKKCIQKVGMVRYSAFKDTGSDLSFALALLDENKDGVVLNGIYSREMSNIYAKPVEQGKSTYTLSEEETQAIEKAIQAEGI